MQPKCDKVATSPVPSRGSPMLGTGSKSINGYMAQMWTKWPHHPCRLEEAQRSTRGEKAEMAMQPKCGQSGYITPAVLGVPNTRRRDKNQKLLCLPNVDKVATSPMPSRGSPTLCTSRKSRHGYAAQMSQSGHITSAISRLPRLGAKRKITNGYGAQMWTKSLHHPCRLGGPQRSARAGKAKMAISPKCGQSDYITPAVSGVPNAPCGEKKQKWLCNPNVDKLATSSPSHLGGPQRSTRGEKAKIAMQPKRGQSGYITPCRPEGPRRSTRGEKA